VRRELIILLAFFSVFLAIGCTGNNTGQPSAPIGNASVTPAEKSVTPNPAETPAIPVTGKTVEVTIQNFAFDPDSITISSGDNIKWTNMDSATHTIVGTDFSSGNLKKGDSYEHIFNKVGTYNYECSIHPYMKGVVIVK
jgi:plastocyanin